MQYRTMKDGTEVSILGYGCMRFTASAGRINLEKAEKEIMLAIENGVNYFDTAYIYGGSEEALGTILERNHCRDKVQIATKLPYYMLKSAASVEKLFQEQLKRLRTDHVDFYLMHMLFDVEVWNRLKNIGIEEWIAEKKQTGAIRNIGFSFHGDTDTFKALIDVYDWDFCQIQYNYLDEHTQAGRAGLLYAAEKNIPVVIMEPLRGGKLVDGLPDSAKKAIEEYPLKRTPAEWAFHWLWDQPQVTCVLSGMNSTQMVTENIASADKAGVGSFTKADHHLIDILREKIHQNLKVGCTGCGYCMPCPHGVDIPTAFRCYNQTALHKKFSVMLEYAQVTSLKKDSSAMTQCTKCGACERHCPQHIEIRKELQNAKKALQPFYVRAALKLIGKFNRQKSS
ncbi:MAG: aldo/keto reductase [Bacteroidales bacterium]|nr:aldo/keto reductase [Bacteroidales bacterium]MCM1417111.1 aldo/keto reductase [bacterium]MCM1424939.1 aldo/keto reductase [bacterium]